jgi:hypothetical protein
MFFNTNFIALTTIYYVRRHFSADKLYWRGTTPCKRNIPFYIVNYYIKGYISLAPSSKGGGISPE